MWICTRAVAMLPPSSPARRPGVPTLAAFLNVTDEDGVGGGEGEGEEGEGESAGALLRMKRRPAPPAAVAAPANNEPEH